MTIEGNEQVESQEEGSPVIKQLRDQLKAEKKARKEAESKLDEAKSLAREEVITEQTLQATGLPESVHDLVKDELRGRQVNEDNVQEAIANLGLQGLTERAQPEPTSEPTQDFSPATDLEDVANLGNQVAQAAQNEGFTNLTDKINAAETPEELAQVMAEAGQ